MITALLLATQLAVVAPDGSRIEEMHQCFTLYRETEQGDVAIGNTLQTVEFVDRQGIPRIRVVVHQAFNNGTFDMRDEFLLERSDMQPIEFSSRFRSSRGMSHEIELHYQADRVTGTKTRNGEVTSVDLPLPSPVWEGNLWGLTFAALPLQADGHYELPFYQYDKGAGSFVVDVVGEQLVVTEAGSVEAWVLQAGILDGPQGRYLIGKKAAVELGYSAAGVRQSLGGDCSMLSAPDGAGSTTT